MKKSYEKYKNEYLHIVKDLGNKEKYDDIKGKVHEYAFMKIKRDLEQGFQGLEYKLNTVGSSRGDYSFVSLTFGLETSVFGKLISKTCLDVRRKGQGKDGYKKPVLFPKLIFLYDEEIHGEGKISEDVFNCAVECCSTSMYPDILSLSGEGYVSDMYKKYKKPISPMG